MSKDFVFLLDIIVGGGGASVLVMDLIAFRISWVIWPVSNSDELLILGIVLPMFLSVLSNCIQHILCSYNADNAANIFVPQYDRKSHIDLGEMSYATTVGPRKYYSKFFEGKFFTAFKLHYKNTLEEDDEGPRWNFFCG